MNNSAFYFDTLYPLQDQILHLFRQVNTGFYLTGGTAASRGYLNHRFSDDLDLFVNDDADFRLWSDRIIQALLQARAGNVAVGLREERFVRLSVKQMDVTLKIELINDVPAHVGAILDHPVLGRLDSAENILANKVTALLDREEPKDLADIWGFCCKMRLSLTEAITGAQSKAAGVFPADLARLLCSATKADWEAIRWISAPPVNDFLTGLNNLGEGLLLPK